ncbi:MAG: dipeptide/oligopeptide/nickel ABC transporter permease/ATP-binding protein [Actinomycetota bacterium]|nr:dipeptide/oligopeptide/nickel ABC transporter permease/ATP-binding protein [Actinomycetota bacterium]
MSETTLPIDTATSSAAPDSLLRRVLRNPTFVVPAVILVVVIVSGLLAPWLTPHDPNATDVANALADPGGEHLLGTDSAGRDVLSRLLYGTRISLGAAALAVVIAVAIGVTSGLVAGYFGGWFDSLSSWMTNLIMALPGIVVLLAASTVLGPSIWTAMAIFGVLMSPAFHRLVYVTVRGVRNELYVDAARVSGLGDARIIGRHILSVVRAPVIIQIGMVASIAIAIQAGLQFLGLGDISVPTWGGLLDDGFRRMFLQGWLLLWPSVVLSATTLSLALAANSIRDELERAGPVGSDDEPAPEDIEIEPTAAEPVRHAAPEPAGTALLAVEDLAVGYPAPGGTYSSVVHDVSLTVAKGEVVGLVGESGSGKTQTALAVLGLLPATGRVLGGSIRFDGEELVGGSGRAIAKLRGRRMAYVPQEPMSNLDPSFTVGSQLTEPMRVCLGLSKKDARRRALELLDRVGIPEPERTFDAYPHEISGGMAQRVLIAGAVSCDPELIIADEPTTALDVTVQAEVLDLLRELQDEMGTGLLLVTHNFGVVADLCDRVAVMQEGHIVESGPVRSVFHDARHPYTKSLLSAILEGGPARAPYTPSPRALEEV